MPRVRLYIRIRRAKGSYAYADPAWNLNRTLRAGYAMVSGEPEPHPEGVYYLRFLSRKKRVGSRLGLSPMLPSPHCESRNMISRDRSGTLDPGARF
jgi:hypothetical protein